MLVEFSMIFLGAIAFILHTIFVLYGFRRFKEFPSTARLFIIYSACSFLVDVASQFYISSGDYSGQINLQKVWTIIESSILFFVVLSVVLDLCKVSQSKFWAYLIIGFSFISLLLYGAYGIGLPSNDLLLISSGFWCVFLPINFKSCYSFLKRRDGSISTTTEIFYRDESGKKHPGFSMKFTLPFYVIDLYILTSLFVYFFGMILFSLLSKIGNFFWINSVSQILGIFILFLGILIWNKTSKFRPNF